MIIIDEQKIFQIEELIKNSKNIVIIGHQNPDADCIGTALSLYLFLKNMNISSEILLPNEFPEFLNWMPDSDKINILTQRNNKAIKILKSSDLIFCVDFNEPSRVGMLEHALNQSSATKIMIDHHPNPHDFADIIFSTIEISSAAELMYLILKKLNQSYINKEIAECIYAGIIMDTGNFFYSSTSSQTFTIASELLNYNIDKEKINSNLFNNFSLTRMRSMGLVLKEKIVVEENYAYICLTNKDLEDNDYKIGDHENFVNLPLQINGIVISALFMENNDLIQVSLRSKFDFPINEIAKKYFNGGGHKNAAGGKSFVSFEETISLFKKGVQEITME